MSFDFWTIALMVPPLLLAITLHEVAHGWVADLLGDPTAREQGRLSINPLRHVDPIGTVAVPLVLSLTGGLLFGWAKPVPVEPGRLRSPRRDMALVALAGPGANLVMALAWALVYHGAYHVYPYHEISATVMQLLAIPGIAVNIMLMVLNLLPLPPLDGGRVLVSALPRRVAAAVARVEPFGILILVALLLTGYLGRILWPPVALLQDLLR